MLTELDQVPEAELERALQTQRRYKGDLAQFCCDAFGITLFSPDQRKILESVPRCIEEHKPLVLPSANAQGKDFISSCISLGLLFTYAPSKVILTAPTDRQLREIMWNEITARWQARKFDLGGRLYQSPKLLIRHDWFMLGFVTKDTSTEIGKAQGFHSPNIFAIASEAQAIPNQIYEQLKGVLTSDVRLLIMIGNPLVTVGKFADSIRDIEHNVVIHMDAENSPNVLEGKTVIPGMATKSWVEEMRREYFDKDPEHYMWLVRVKGRLPRTSVYNVFSTEDLDKAKARVVNWIECRRSLGLDFAEFGDDESAFCFNESGAVRILETTSKQEPTATAGKATAMRIAQEINTICGDADGLGGPILSMIREMIDKDSDVQVISAHAQGKPTAEQNAQSNQRRHSPYANLRTEMWFYAAGEMREGRASIPDDPFLIQELTAQTYTYTRQGQIILTEKKEIKKIIGRSPDRADAYINSVWGLRFAEPIEKKSRGKYHPGQDEREDTGDEALVDPNSQSWMTA